MISNGKSNVDNEYLICPITYEMFHDPVVAGDGHIYERTAIVRWICEHGTSPLTRQPLNINELQSDDYLRNLANQQRTSTTPSNNDISIDHTTIQRQNSIISYNYNINLDQPIVIQQQRISNNTIVPIDSSEIRYLSYSIENQRKCCVSTFVIIALVLFFLFIREIFDIIISS
jgi:hypothetical protein